MEVKSTNEEIIIKLSKKDHKQLFSRVSVMKDVKAYFEYLLDLDVQLNGSDNAVLNGYQNVESFKESLKRMDCDELNKSKDELLKDIYNYVDYIYDAVPSEYTYTSYSDELDFIPEDDSIAYLKLTTDKLKALLNHLQRKEGN